MCETRSQAFIWKVQYEKNKRDWEAFYLIWLLPLFSNQFPGKATRLSNFCASLWEEKGFRITLWSTQCNGVKHNLPIVMNMQGIWPYLNYALWSVGYYTRWHPRHNKIQGLRYIPLWDVKFVHDCLLLFWRRIFGLSRWSWALWKATMALFLHTARQGLARPTPSLGELRAMWTVESSRAPSLSFSAKSRSGATTHTPCISPTWRFTMRQAMTFSTLTMKLKLWKICPRYKEIPTILNPI